MSLGCCNGNDLLSVTGSVSGFVGMVAAVIVDASTGTDVEAEEEVVVEEEEEEEVVVVEVEVEVEEVEEELIGAWADA